MAWAIETVMNVDGGVQLAPRLGLDEFELMLAGDDRVQVAEWAVGAIADGTWRDLALDLVDETTRDCFVSNWDHPQILIGFENVLRKVIATNLPVKVTGMVGDDYEVVSAIGTARIVVCVWAPAT